MKAPGALLKCFFRDITAASVCLLLLLLYYFLPLVSLVKMTMLFSFINSRTAIKTLLLSLSLPKSYNCLFLLLLLIFVLLLSPISFTLSLSPLCRDKIVRSSKSTTTGGEKDFTSGE